MKYFSDVTKKFYDKEDECKEAEEKALAEKKEADEKKAKLAEARKARAKELEELYKKAQDAKKEYNEAVTAFIKDFGSYHYTISNTNDLFNEVFETFCRIF